MEILTVDLNIDDLKNLREIGCGTDGCVFAYKDNMLIKIYHHKLEEIFSTFNSKDDDTKIFESSKHILKNNYAEHLTYYSYSQSNNESIRILPKYAIDKAIERRENVELTSLPLGKVVLNNRLAGCILEKQKGIQIHKLTGMPLVMRKKILLNILKAINELLKNYIYHIDLANSPFDQQVITLPNNQIAMTGHSHVLVNPLTLKTSIIDLDGKSTIYTETENKFYKNLCLSNLSTLIIEFLFQYDWNSYQECPEQFIQEMNKYGIPNDLIEKFVYENMTEIDDYYELVRTLK